jgi:septum formation inhibitor MinC
MSKITIVSRPDQHLLIDISGCTSFKEAIEQLSAALLNANQFWQGTIVDFNLGSLLLTKAQLAQIMALTKGVGISAKRTFAQNPETIKALTELEVMMEIAVNNEEAAQLSSVAVMPDPEPLFSCPPSEYSPYTDSARANNTDMPVDKSLEQMTVSAPNDQKEASPLNVAQQASLGTSKRQSLYIKQTLRAGQAVSHKGDLIIVGDVNAGAEVIAEGDIAIWGSLRGIAHAGVGGDTKAEIRALRLQPIQLRIAHYIARSPDALLTSTSALTASPFMAETAKLVDGKIRILRETFD